MDKKVLLAPIKSVLVMEDRAQITRNGALSLTPGIYNLVLENVTPLINKDNLQLSFEGQKAIIHNFKVERRYHSEAYNADEENRYREEAHQLDKEARKIWYDVMNQCSRFDYLSSTSHNLNRQMHEHMSLGQLGEGWLSGFQDIWNDQDQITEKIFELSGHWEDKRSQYENTRQKLNAIKMPESKYTADILMTVEVKEEADLKFMAKYGLPCALWRAYYNADLEGNTLTWDSCACLWQNTGEDWENVELEFSTARPSLGGELAPLRDDYLSKQKKTKNEIKNVQIESREQAINVSSQGGEDKVSDTPPGMNDGGEVRNFKAKTKCSVISNGRANIIPLNSWTTEVELTSICHPEKTQRVYVQTKQVNQSNMPLLAGPVNLVRDGGHIGRVNIDFVAAGEKFDVSWGGIDEISIVRSRYDSKKTAKITGSNTHKFSVELSISNGSDTTHRVKIVERIPVSDLADISVKILEDDTLVGYKQDENGLVSWEFDIEGYKHYSVDLAYEVKMAKKYNWHP